MSQENLYTCINYGWNKGVQIFLAHPVIEIEKNKRAALHKSSKNILLVQNKKLTISEFAFSWSTLNICGISGPIQMSNVCRGYLKNEVLLYYMSSLSSIYCMRKGHAIRRIRPKKKGHHQKAACNGLGYQTHLSPTYFFFEK